jgi:hypothetical protein
MIVQRYWKGELSSVMVVFAGRNRCQNTFLVGDEYLGLAYFPEGERFLRHLLETRTPR